ncbi:LytR/AlgR family response regulator transcription factor [Vallitalea maricola]|uniref:LytTR family DNA-binding domain-containing protein n=1 Tax=Vallitalea maricola TaxID=3074433 RepID=A0ACB5UGE1_9FIRM|nr:LytTR family DNA-binding domain-containing protein [Vallitalea sp. AN17-2]
MRIAIVDDLKNERTLVQKLASQYFDDRKTLYDVTPHFEEYETGERFLENYIPGKYEIVFLDIYMDKITGIDVAKRIATFDKDCSIIFFTTSDEHQLDGYSVHAIGYIMKPISDHLPAFYTAMDYAASRLLMDQAGITVTTDCGEIYLHYRNIVYIDCIGRTTYFHLTNMDLTVLGKFKDYQPIFLADNRFLECYRNIIINMDYIDRPDNDDFILKSGEKLPISRRKKATVLENHMTYFVKKRGM